MRLFYIFYIKDYVYDTYNKYPYQLYKILEDTYYVSKHDLVLSSNYYEQITNKFNKLFINNYLSINYKLNSYYLFKNNTHILSNNSENSKLIVSSNCLKLKTNVNYPTFFDTLIKYKNNIFICDFQNQDYFWLNKVVAL